MNIFKILLEWFASYLAIIVALVTGKMMLSDDSDLPPHLRRENQHDY